MIFFALFFFVCVLLFFVAALAIAAGPQSRLEWRRDAVCALLGTCARELLLVDDLILTNALLHPPLPLSVCRLVRSAR